MTPPTENSRPQSKPRGRHSCLLTLLAIMAVVGFIGAILVGVGYLSGQTITKPAKNSLGVIEIKGVIISSEFIVKNLVKFRKDENIKAIILRIDSPGGGVAATQEIYSEIIKTRKTKKVIASMGSVAASGGLYIAASANKIMANPGTLTGSIGVIMQFANYEELFKKIGLKSVVIKSGEFKDIGSPARGMTKKEKAYLQSVVEEIHQQFVRDVAVGRGMPVDKVAALADGRIFTGEKAVKLGLVDKLGNYQDAIDWAKKLAGITGKTNLVYPPKKKFDFFDMLSTKLGIKLWPQQAGSPLKLQFLYFPII